MTIDSVAFHVRRGPKGFGLREAIKWALFPGLNLHARLRYRTLPQYFREPHSRGPTPLVLDAGCGNGMLSYQSYLKGNRVIGLSIKEGEIIRNRKLFNQYHGISEEDLQFRVHNLYDVESLNVQFDEIICTEVLEHIRRDTRVCSSLFRVLKPGGVLHLCCPNAAHRDNREARLDRHETGGHVRAGYTYDRYRALLEPIGFKLSHQIGLGGRARQIGNNLILSAQHYGGFGLGLAAFTVTRPLTALDALLPTAVPFCLYVQAEKPRWTPRHGLATSSKGAKRDDIQQRRR